MKSHYKRKFTFSVAPIWIVRSAVWSVLGSGLVCSAVWSGLSDLFDLVCMFLPGEATELVPFIPTYIPRIVSEDDELNSKQHPSVRRNIEIQLPKRLWATTQKTLGSS